MSFCGGLRSCCRRWGCQPARLAQGYTALIPKEGPPGPPNMRPLLVLSMVHCLWAGVHRAWLGLAHPSALGFRPVCNALDGAAVTQVLLQLCRLRRWAMVGMSNDGVSVSISSPKPSC